MSSKAEQLAQRARRKQEHEPPSQRPMQEIEELDMPVGTKDKPDIHGGNGSLGLSEG